MIIESMQKLLLLNDSGNFGGVQSVFRNITKYCDFKNYEVKILFCSNGPIYDEVKSFGYEIDYIQSLKKLSKKDEIILLIKEILRLNSELKNNYDKVYANGFMSCVATGVLSFKYKNTKFIWHEHNMPKSKLRKRFLKFISKNIKKIIIVSEGIKNNYFTNDDRLVVLYNGIESDDKDYFQFKSKDKIKLGIVSRIDQGKGHLEVIEAFNKVNRDDMELYIIGNATSRDASVIEEKIKGFSKTNSNIKYEGYSRDVAKYYKELDFVIQASTAWDSLPTVLIEAMNYNCALIGSDIGGIPEIIDKRNGYIVNNNDVTLELYRLFQTIIKDDKLKSMQINSKKVLSEKFILTTQMDTIKKIVNEV